MGVNYLWDTSIAIYYLQRQFTPTAEKFIDEILKNNQPSVSVVTEIELLSWRTTNDRDVVILKNFLSDSLIFDLTPAIKNRTAELRKTLSIKLPDSIIAATALVEDLTLITRNTQDFKKCSGLKVVNPFES